MSLYTTFHHTVEYEYGIFLRVYIPMLSFVLPPPLRPCLKKCAFVKSTSAVPFSVLFFLSVVCLVFFCTYVVAFFFDFLTTNILIYQQQLFLFRQQYVNFIINQ